MNAIEATDYLNSQPTNDVRAAATAYLDAAGADWDGTHLSVLRGGQWYTHKSGDGPAQQTGVHIGVALYLQSRR